MQRAIATYEKKYQMKLPGPVHLEVYPNHDDFIVRTLGLPGQGGLLGVTFGLTVAMDSPTARGPGQFSWASTMWHEFSHVFVLTAPRITWCRAGSPRAWQCMKKAPHRKIGATG
jgi:hypothetical protein